jgi:hypothetical protein
MLECRITPELDAYFEQNSDVVDFDVARGALTFKSRPSPSSVECLKACQPDDGTWALRLEVALEDYAVSLASQSSAYPMTQWSLLVTGLGSESDQAWREFMDAYRRPISRSLRLLQGIGASHSESEESLAEQYFGWLFEKQYYKKLNRVGAGGDVHRFRGWLKNSLRYFLKDVRGGLARQQQPAEGELEALVSAEGMSGNSSVENALDRELARDFVRATLELIRRDERSTWRVLMALLGGETLESIAGMLAKDEGARGGSVSSAGREKFKALDTFRSLLIRFRLGPGCVTQEETVQEFQELIPLMAAALAEYREEQE